MADNDVPTRRNCGTMEVHERLLRTVPGYMEARAKSENHALRAMAMPFAGRTGCTSIPVVVHVVYKTNAQNIDDAQIQSQIDVLNDDFRMKNVDVASVPSAFQPAAADARITFTLASTDPAGEATNGITRTKTDKTVFSASTDDIKAAATDGADAWPADAYLNVWVAPRLTDASGNNLLGYAQFPGGPAATDGVVILHSAFGTTGTASAPFDRGRTTTHEIGHWLNLRHIWGDDGTGCSGSDFVNDTPNQGGPNYGAPAFPHVSCGNGPNGDMFVNYMDYVDDAAMMMFTAEQVVRMQATLDGSRSSIGTTAPCLKFPVKDLPKDPPKEFPKDLPKDPPKDFPKDPPKDWPKDPPKEFPKDLPKEIVKDIPRDPPKGMLEPPKGLLEPPKGLLEPPKGLLEPPKGLLEPPKGLMEPPIDLSGGGMPFVLATPPGGMPGGAQPAAQAAAQAQAMLRQQANALLDAYAQLLTQYATLYARGLLDAAGLAAWQQAAAAYQQLVGYGGAGS